MHFVYFARSLKNSKVYVGYTSKKPEERIAEHNSGTNKWSKANGPFKLIFYETYLCKMDAIQKESFYKSGVGKRIKKVIIKEMDP